MKKIAEIASIRNGYAFRGRIESERNGDTRVIQASDLKHDTELDTAKLVCVHLGKKADRYRMNKHDIVFTSRGQRQFATQPISKSMTDEPIITSFGLLVISADREKVLPEYLHWVLNTQQIQHRIQVLSDGTSISFISDKNLADVEVPVPSLNAQKNITQLIAVHEERARVRNQLADLDTKLTQATAWSLATEKTT